jgi:tetratricopeptide (TPR) repeat protein
MKFPFSSRPWAARPFRYNSPRLTPTLKDRLQLALNHHTAGRLAEAESLYLQILAEDSNNADALHLLGYLIHQSRRDPGAAGLIIRAIMINPDAFQYHNSLGLVLLESGRPTPAATSFQIALAIKPDSADTHNNLGSALQAQNKLEPAIAAYRAAIHLNPKLTAAYNNLGSALTSLGDLPSAADALRQALELNPNLAKAHNTLGYVLFLQDLPDNAIPHIERAIALDPNYADAHNNLGIALAALGQIDRPIACHRKALSLQPDFATAHWALANVLLKRDEYEEGFTQWEWRLKVPELKLKMDFPQPVWDGSDLAGRRIVLITEQGAGDAIQFVRYAPLVAQRGGRVIIVCREPLARLLATAPGVIEHYVQHQAVPNVDLRCPLESLPTVFKTTFQTIPAQTPYLFADPTDSARWAARMPTDRLKIGLVWSGQAKPNPRRSMPVTELAPLAELPNIWWLSLQVGEAAAQASSAGFPLVNWSDELNDYADTAALMNPLDLIITIDTSVAHLAGALGKPVWVMLPHVADWRFGLGRDTCPWYPTMRLFRQPGPGDWTSVIQQVVAALKASQNLHP